MSSVLVKPAGPDCNIACEYCFYRSKEALFPERVHRMSEAVLARLICQVMEQSGPEVSIGWQGGEPTLMGLPFFEQAVELEQRHGREQRVGNGLQTNGLLLGRRWARFFRQFDFLIGLSIDGPEEVHDHYRRTLAGGPTWARVRDVAGMLLDEGVAVNALTVVNDFSARFPDEIYDFHRRLGLSFMQLIPCVETDPSDPGRAAGFSVSADAYAAFLCRIYDLWRADFVGGRPTTSVRLFESLLFSYAGLPPPECTLCAECGSYLVVEHTGDVYACDFFVEPRWHLGNVMHNRLDEMLASPLQAQFGHLKARLPAPCLECRWRLICRGGCTKDRLRDARDAGRSHFCGAYTALLEHADADLRQLAAQQRRMHRAASLHPAELAGPAGRNDPCPCGSGLKYKKCCLRGSGSESSELHPSR